MPVQKPFKLKVQIPYEQDIQKAILTQLAYHPLVAWCGRINSGAAMLPCGRGKMRPVKFNTIKGCSDIIGQLRDGRFLAIEVKRPPWTRPTDDHEREQEAFLNQVKRAGGVAFFATSIEEVRKGLDLTCV